MDLSSNKTANDNAEKQLSVTYGYTSSGNNQKQAAFTKEVVHIWWPKLSSFDYCGMYFLYIEKLHYKNVLVMVICY